MEKLPGKYLNYEWVIDDRCPQVEKDMYMCPTYTYLFDIRNSTKIFNPRGHWKDVFQWCIDNCKCKWTDVQDLNAYGKGYQVGFLFENKNEAMLFKLVFGGIEDSDSGVENEFIGFPV